MKRLRTCIAIARRPGNPECAATSHAWRPLTLTWRRSAARSTAAAPVRARAAMHRHWHTQLQLTWNSWLTAAPPRRAPARATASANVARRHSVSRIQLIRDTRTRVESRQELLRLRTISNLQRERVTRTSQATATFPVTTPRAPMTSALQVGHSQPRALPVSATMPNRVGHPESVARSVAPLVHRARPRAMSEERVVPRAPAVIAKPAPLVWLKPPAAERTSVPAEEISRSGAPIVTTHSMAPATRVAAATPATQAQAAREAVRSSLMDTSVVDRLAEDVMKRVEKRLRIERERRGL